MNDSQWRQHRNRLIFEGTFAGAASGMGVAFIGGLVGIALMLAGALLGGCMATAVAMLSRSGPENPLAMRRVLAFAMVAGLTPGIPIAGVYAYIAPPQFWRPVLFGILSTCMLYSVLFIGFYRLRRRWDIALAVLSILAAGFLLGCLRGYLMTMGDHGEESPPRNDIILLCGLFGGLPFAVFWTLAVCRNDPAYSQKRWDRLFPQPEANAPPESDKKPATGPPAGASEEPS